MFQIGDKVIYKTNGVCTVEAIAPQSMPTGVTDCYVLRPLSDGAIKIYVPLNNETLVGHVHSLLSADEMLALFERAPSLSMRWIEELRARTNTFRDLMAVGDRDKLAAMIKLIYEKRLQLKQSGKRLYAADEAALKKAEKLLFEEAALALEMTVEDAAMLFASKVMSEADRD